MTVTKVRCVIHVQNEHKKNIYNNSQTKFIFIVQTRIDTWLLGRPSRYQYAF